MLDQRGNIQTETRSRMTVFRRLKEIGYRTSFTHAGRYYTLADIPKFEEQGLWFHKDAGFSTEGTLKETVATHVERAPDGRTSAELHHVLRVPSVRPPRHRFTLIFDREGYSPEFFSQLKDQHVACVTYHKFPQESWPVEEFYAQTVRLVTGESVVMKLAERGTRMKNGLWLRQFRKLSAQGHQTAILTTDYHTDADPLAASMFARWSQENFFKYARKHFALDKLADYQTESVDETVVLVNPAYRTLDGQVRSCQAKLQRSLAEFGATACVEPIEPRQMESYLQKKAALQECIEQRTAELATLKTARKETPRHVTIKDLPEAERFKQLSTQSKCVIDTIKMIAYRAETAMAATVRESMSMSRPDKARTLLRALYTTEADLIPDHVQNTLIVRLHHSANACNDGVIRALCEKLNETETLFPRTNLRLIFALGSN